MGPRRPAKNDQGNGDLDVRGAGRGASRRVSRHRLRRAGRLLRRVDRRFLQLVLQRLHLDTLPAADPRHRRGAEPKGDAHRDPHPGPHRLDRDLSPRPRRIPQAQGARIHSGGRRDRRFSCAAHVRAYPSEREPRHIGAAVPARRSLHQIGGGAELPRFRRRRGHGFVGQHAQRGPERADPRLLVAARRSDPCHGAARHRVQPVHRCPARRARPQAQMTSVNSSGTLIGIRDLKVDFRLDRTTVTQAVKGIGFDIPVNSTVALVGESGSGKSVTALAILGLLPKENSTVPPATAPDVTIQKQILELIAALQRRLRMSVLFITHDLALVGEIADYVVVMREGEIKEQGRVEQIFEAPRDPYTRALLLCRPQLERRPRRLPVIDDFLKPGPLAGGNLEERSRRLRGDREIILEVRHLAKSFYSREGLFGKREFKAVKDVSFRLARGKTLGIVGESGSGKTTVALTLLRLRGESSGEALFDGKDLLSIPQQEMMPYKRRIQIVFQNPYASLNPRFTIGQLLMEPLQVHGIGSNESERRDRVYKLLEEVGLPEVSFFKYPHEFSGGQRQRIAIARCLTMKPDVLICDESVSALDVSVQAQVLNLLQDLQDEYHMSYIFISHDLSVVKYISDQVMVMNQGEVVEMANSDDIYLRPQHPYTQKLLASIPRGWQGSTA